MVMDGESISKEWVSLENVLEKAQNLGVGDFFRGRGWNVLGRIKGV